MDVPVERPAATKERLMSLDALRGFDMFWIIGGGAVLAAFAKVHPNRFTLTLESQLQEAREKGEDANGPGEMRWRSSNRRSPGLCRHPEIAID